MWPASFHKSEDSHEQRKSRERRIFQHLLKIDRLGSRKTAAIDVHVQEIRPQDHSEKTQHDNCKHWSPDPQAPSNQKEQPKDNFREGQRMSYELHSPGGQQLECFHLSGKIGKVHRHGKFQNEKRPQIPVRQKNLCVARVNENAAENQAANPNDRAAEIPWAGLCHALIFSKFFISG
jgi:hypothetical protein